MIDLDREQDLDIYYYTCKYLKEDQLENELFALDCYLNGDYIDDLTREHYESMKDIVKGHLATFQEEDDYVEFDREEASYYGM